MINDYPASSERVMVFDNEYNIITFNPANGPKKRRIRTDIRVESGKRSEKEKNSDRMQSGIGETVRKREEFGQVAECNQGNGPKKRRIRTDSRV